MSKEHCHMNPSESRFELTSETGPEIIREESSKEPEDGIALCLSGGGYRAMLFHVGAIIRLNECAVLPKLARVSSVSGGSITGAVLGLNWNRLDFDANGRAVRLDECFVDPICRMAAKTIDCGSILAGVILPGSVSDRIVGYLQDALFGDATLQDLPADQQGPRFVINATSVQSGALVRMSRPYLADYRVGILRKPTILLAEAVAASAAFPPFLSPCEIDVEPSAFEVNEECDLQREPYTSSLVLTDGGVYDNLGLETAWKRYRTILVSDGGGKMAAEPEPAGDWAQHSKRVIDIMNDQVVSLRVRQVIRSFDERIRKGTYWGIRTNISDYGLADSLPAPHEFTQQLAETPTRLKRLPRTSQERLMNWGYAVCDAALRRYAKDVISDGSAQARFPFDTSME